MVYVALLRGINVGGNNMIKMADLKEALTTAGLDAVTTYIQSGNVVFASAETSKTKLVSLIEETISTTFGLTVTVVVLSLPELEAIANNTPKDWLKREDWKYNYIFLLPNHKIDQVITALGELKPEYETIDAGTGILYQAGSIASFSRTAASRMIGKPVYKLMTIRNHNTVTKLLTLAKTL